MHVGARVHMHAFGIRPMQTDMQDETRNPGRPIPEPALCNCLALRQAARHATQFYDRHLAAEGLKTSQYSILAKLLRLRPQSEGARAGEMGVDRATTRRAVQPLARDKLVAIAPGEDERTRMVRITPAGEKRTKAAAARWREAPKEFETGYGAAAAG